jgi:hypothetical protein
MEDDAEMDFADRQMDVDDTDRDAENVLQNLEK